MVKKLLIAGVTISGLMSAQCNYKCSYNQDENGNTVHLKQCNEYKKLQQDKLFDLIYSKPSGPVTPLIKSKWMNMRVLQMVE